MKKLHFAYDMKIEYSVPVGRCHFTIKCIPKDTMRQKVENFWIELFPETPYRWGKDGLRNLQIYGINEESHKIFQFHIEGDVTTGLSDFEEEEIEDISMIFRHPHGLNVAGDHIRAFYDKWRETEEMPVKNIPIRNISVEEIPIEEIPIEEISVEKSCIRKTAYETAIELMHALYQSFSYQACTTSVHTTAEEAFAQGHGVCQDYAHIFISLLHLSGISARYVTGLIIGEGQSHAWVEILHEGKWYGLDPTNDCKAGDDYIKIGIGRDAGDCMINRGIMHGGGLHIQTIYANITERK